MLMAREHNSKRATVLMLLPLLAAVSEVVEERHAVGLRPDADFARLSESLVLPFERGLAIEGDFEMIPLEVHAQSVPLVRGDFHFRAFLLSALAVDGVINRDVVFERVGARDIIIVRVLATPDDAARLVFLARDRFELHFHKAVLDARVILEADRVSGFAGLFQDVGFAGRGVVLFNGPPCHAFAGLSCRPARWSFTGLRVV